MAKIYEVGLNYEILFPDIQQPMEIEVTEEEEEYSTQLENTVVHSNVSNDFSKY